MKKISYTNNKNAGITLIALIITIIILLILTGVTIKALKDFSFFNKTKKATGNYTNSQKQEENILNNYENEIAYSETKTKYKGKTWNFDYTGGEQVFQVPADAMYQLEIWGAQGGSYSEAILGGYGGYAVGNVKLHKDDKLYINIGGKGLGDGTHGYRAGGYNGGGNATSDGDGNTRQSSGGGATHIALLSGLLSTLEKNINDIIIVSGGGRRWIS